MKALSVCVCVCVSLSNTFSAIKKKKKLRLFKYLIKERMTAGKPAHLYGTAVPEYGWNYTQQYTPVPWLQPLTDTRMHWSKKALQHCKQTVSTTTRIQP